MTLAKLLCDLLEFVAVFLLSVEAIKLQNLRLLQEKVTLLHRRVNPEVVFVDELPIGLSFFE